MLDDYLKQLNPQQLEAVQHENSPLLILAGAGSGKTRVITTKISYLISEKHIDPYSILAVTFTKKAANEMRERAISLEPRAAGAQIKTFHSFGAWFLRRYAENIGLEPNFTVYDDDDMAVLVRKAVPSLCVKEAKMAAKQIALAKDYCLTPEDDLSMLASDLDIPAIYYEYQKRLRATGNTDFGDLITLPYELLRSDPAIAASIHSRFKVVMVDEYQDSNIAQYKLLQELSGIKTDNPAYVCVVGDDDQSIYKFRGAEVRNILSFPDEFKDTKVIRLETNYRSTGNILNAANLVVSKNTNRLGKTLVPAREEGGMPVIAFLPDQGAESTFCADLIMRSLSAGASYKDWAILYRTNAQSLNFEKEFLHRKIPYKVVGSLKFYEREEIKDTLAYIALCANPRDEISFRRVINKPARGIGEKKQDSIMEKAVSPTGEFTNLIDAVKELSSSFPKAAKEGATNFVKNFEELSTFFDDAEGLNLSSFIRKIINLFSLEEFYKASDEIEGTQRVANLDELVNSAAVYECSKQGLVEFLDAINLDRSLDVENENVPDDSVTLITVHNTKGLEFNKVIITGMEEGVFPRIEKVGAELEEERRLFYVGITRAKNDLFITSTSQRVMYGSWQYMRPSPFICDSASAFRVLGSAPYGFGDSAGTGVTDEDLKWKKGTKVYHDDYGYGVVINCERKEGELVIRVQFETGEQKTFMPEYTKNSLMIVKF